MNTPPGGGCFRYAFDPGSSITIDITGSAGDDDRRHPAGLDVHAAGLGNHRAHLGSATTWSGGATGTLVDDLILWTDTTPVVDHFIVTAWSKYDWDSQAGWTLSAPLPEPGAAGLVLLGLGALALRSRAS